MANIVLRRAEAAPKILAALDAGALLRQKYPDADCNYRGEGGCPCAIGVLLSDEQVEAMGREKLYRFRFVTADVDDIDWFCDVQDAHDGRRWDDLRALVTPSEPCFAKASPND